MVIPELAWFAGLFMICAAALIYLAEDESTAETGERQEQILNE